MSTRPAPTTAMVPTSSASTSKIVIRTAARAVSERASRPTVAPVSRYCPPTSCRTSHSASATGSMSERPTLWVSFGPNGDAHQISLSFNNTANLDNAVLVSKSPAGSAGQQWGAPITLKRDTNPAVFNDKESITADQNNANYVYAVWDRLVFPNERTHGKSYLNTAAFRGPTWFSRTTNGGSSWETARPIFDPGQNDQTIGNQIVALGNGDLVNVMTCLQ